VRFAVFGLTISSSWGNGHATLWRGLCRGLAERGHSVTFFERDVPYYAAHRDATEIRGCDLRLYSDWDDVYGAAVREVRRADVAMITSFCPDAAAACRLVLDSSAPVKTYYDMDTPVTLETVRHGDRPEYVPEYGLGDFDLVLSYTGGGALEGLRTQLGARTVAPLYGSVDPAVHRPTAPPPPPRSRLSYIGTYAADRQPALDALFLHAARQRPDLRFVLAGSQYPADFKWTDNIFYLAHLPPGDHAAFYSTSDWTLNVTRGPMAALGYCPSGRLFEAAACGAPIISDAWPGLDQFFEPGEEIVVAHTTADVLEALEMDDEDRREIGERARTRALACHTALKRAEDLETIIAPVLEDRCH
jgi:spore maturation protein CgeB